jgi:hypothetical protein
VKKKKHRQHKNVYLNSKRSIRVGGIVVPYWPAYWGGPSQNDQGAHDDHDRDETGGISASDGSGGADSSGSV